ncbi:hypothetical protein CRG98_025302 [Punica granatum]|uniref:Uncharacterized protein n=1 Tax=Punica granatum TaxID=22663 RepID=A0A2I0JDI7_PUNGR|nr:hypothetical protein CRG98_025302 [Punica granatum]
MLRCKGRHIRGARRTGARGWSAREVCWRAGRAAVHAGELLCAAGRASVRLRVHCSPESTIFDRNEEINLK